MAQENNNVRRCGQIGEGEDDELSLADVIDVQDRLLADADAVLGGSDENNCTYPQGYIKRQALYACATCTPNGNAGICLACSYACHEGHDLHELYTKRYFTCDCGNEKFGGKECKLFKGAKGLSSKNHYNHNFKGLYCSCARPYPDPESSVEDNMIQCILCEDWFHEEHLKGTVPNIEDFHEMTCPDCMSKYAFLWAYYTPRPVKMIDDSESAADETIEVGSDGDNPALTAHPATDANDTECKEEPLPKVEQTCSQNQTIIQESSLSPSPDNTKKRQIDDGTATGSEENAPSSKRVKLETENDHKNTETKQDNESADEECILKSLQERTEDYPDSAAFWQTGWRSKLCQCKCCLQMYKDRDIEFLIDESDTFHAYEQKGKDSAGSSVSSEEDTTATLLAGMGRVQQIEVIRGFRDLQTELNKFLNGFAQNGKVVTETDIREFFQRMDQRRKDGMRTPQYNCR